MWFLSKGDPNNDWEGVIAELSSAIKNFIGEKTHATIVSDFSTTGPVEKAISEIVLMDIVKKYISYGTITRCGIPAFFLGGTKNDWQLLRKKSSALVKLDAELHTWGVALDSIFEEISKSFENVTNDLFWDSFYKYNHVSGGSVVTGWINVLFPYLQDNGNYIKNLHSRKKWNDETTYWGIKPNLFPCGLSKIPFVWEYLGERIDMEFIGGMVGASQNDEGILRPEFGWAVVEYVYNA